MSQEMFKQFQQFNGKFEAMIVANPTSVSIKGQACTLQFQMSRVIIMFS